MSVEELSEEERAWLERDEALWRRARVIAERHPHLDVGDLYHTLAAPPRQGRRSQPERGGGRTR